jgi:hypothetical protein
MQYSIGRVYRFAQVFRYYNAGEGVYAASPSIVREGMQAVSPPGICATIV